MPGDICLRDDVVTHRCLTCSKNYRCELQTSNELIDMGEFEEPWVGDYRSYYESPPPEPDRANPFLEFDPQMCIICTRCVRACADLRHTTAISLAGKGFEARIAFGTGGPVHESACDFCGACIDVCPTATLMEKPNKWIGRADDWTQSVCNSCSVGCTISYGTVDERPVIVRPDRLNPFSRDQICVRGRFGYDAVTDRERLTRHLARRGANLLPVSFDEALGDAIEAVARVKREHGAGAVAVLGSPLASNEEAYLLRRLARDAIGTPHLDFSQGPVHRAVEGALSEALGVDRRPARLEDLETAQTIVAVGGDLEESHQVVSLRIKDAVVKHGAKLVVVSPRWGELVPFAAAWVQPAPGAEAATLHTLAQSVAGDPAVRERLTGAGVGDIGALGTEAPALPGVAPDTLATAEAILEAGAAAEGGFHVVYAPGPLGADAAAAEARAVANLAVVARPPEAGQSLHYLPSDANAIGIADMGVEPGDGGRSFPEIVAAAAAGEVRALVLHRDNPLLSAPGATQTAAALEHLEALVVIDSVRSTASEHATALLAESPFHATRGTTTNAARRVGQNRHAMPASGDERTATSIIAALAEGLGTTIGGNEVTAVTDEVAGSVEGYLPWAAIESGRSRALIEAERPAEGEAEAAPAARSSATLQAAPGPAAAREGLALVIGRSLFTSWEGASIRSEEADKLHREDVVTMNPADAEAAGVRGGDTVDLSDGSTELRIGVRLDDGIGPGWVYVPQYYDGGAVMRLLPLEGAGVALPTVRVRALQPA
jgi:predicted molibdopterin-dependent oxidoreductase YjgC